MTMQTTEFSMERFAAVARAAAAEGCVLLRNENAALPLESCCRVAVFGRTQMNDFKSGLGCRTGAPGSVSCRRQR